MADRGQAIASVEEIAPVSDRDERLRRPPQARTELAVAAAALHQPRVVVAALQPPRAGRGRQRTATRCSSGCASCRSRPTTSTNSSWCASPASRARCAQGITDQSPDGLTPNEQLARIGEAVSQLASDQQQRWLDLRPALAAAGVVLVDGGRPQEGRARLARGALPHPRLPAADAAGDRSGASVPVHSQSRLLDRAAARARQATARR